MDRELAWMLALTRRLPAIRGAGVLSCQLRRLYNRRSRAPVLTTLHSEGFTFTLELDPNDDVEGNLLFHPQLYDHEELAFLREHLPPGGCFVDIGSNIGLYSLVAARAVGPEGRVLAIDADRQSCERLRRNLSGNGISNVSIAGCGVSDQVETLRFFPNTSGNRGGSSFLFEGPESIEVSCQPLCAILREQGITRVDAAKMDIEGFEYRVLKAFLRDASEAEKPRALVVEFFEGTEARAGGNPVSLLLENGYRLHRRLKQNHLMVRS